VGTHHLDSSPPGFLDVLVLGSGVAGLSVAMSLCSKAGAPEVRAAKAGTGEVGTAEALAAMRVGILTKGELADATTRWAQGGVAVVLPVDGCRDREGRDSTDLHLVDTVAAGAGLCDTDAAGVLVKEGPRRVKELIALGTVFDRQPSGELALAREGGHSTARVVHAGGAATGAEVERALVAAVRATPAVILEGWLALDLLVEADRCRGVVALDPAGDLRQIRAANVVLATGGAGQLFSVTTNPPEATGDGIAMALRAGVAVTDLEFVQFHPTALYPGPPRRGNWDGQRPSSRPQAPGPRLLLSEALRGHGAILRDAEGQHFVDELAPRDVVSRAMAQRLAAQGVPHLWLDATGLAHFAERFPAMAGALEAYGLDPASDWLPVAPAAHYLSGGVVTDLDGATSLPGLWACGEVACTGVHGANRLASNSLLEGLVFAGQVVDAIAAGRLAPRPTGAMRAVLGSHSGQGIAGWPVPMGDGDAPGEMSPEPAVTPTSDIPALRSSLQSAMTALAGVVRDATSLAGAAEVVERVRVLLGAPEDRAGWELLNLIDVASALLIAASARTETRGAHTRSDCPDADPVFQLRLVHGGNPRNLAS